MATPIGIAESGGRIIVVCDDGTVYRCDAAFESAPEEARWVSMPPVPNTEFEERLARAERQEGGGLQWLPSPGVRGQRSSR